MWLEVTYRPTSLFSLKSSQASSSAGKSLISPSPYSVKMALLNATITYDSLAVAMDHFEFIRDLDMCFALPKQVVVNNCFLKIQKKQRSDTRKGEWDNFQPTVAFREYLYFDGDIKIGFQMLESEDSFKPDNVDFLMKQLARINYFGKKGCFFQFISASRVPKLSDGYCKKFYEEQISFTPGLLMPMDDFGQNVSFHMVNTYSSAKTVRTKKVYSFPYRVVRTNKSFTMLERIE